MCFEMRRMRRRELRSDLDAPEEYLRELASAIKKDPRRMRPKDWERLRLEVRSEMANSTLRTVASVLEDGLLFKNANPNVGMARRQLLSWAVESGALVVEGHNLD